MDKTSLGLEENMEASLSYIMFFISGIFFLIVEKENKFVHFHSLQSTITFLIFFSAQIILMPLIGVPILNILVDIIRYLLNVLSIIVWLVCMYKAYNHEKYKLPLIGDIVEKIV
ncbi:MAG: hypothetical protein C0173_01255 [Desulfurella sp.]|uniref:DUF4870 domain-containing protein n=1 Tax=Desulfurella sp. TaxID=1962857 RepID=UPI000CC0D23D|nr:hypothetical protein [Desulfurella sp.]PMP93108.1 MAG: hypothetical protein C0173_01255 [Desulfurella sp.]